MKNSLETAKALEGLVQLFPAFFKQVLNELKARDMALCTSAQFRTLSAIENGTSWRMSDLSEKLRVSNGSLTIMINKLMEDDLVDRGRSTKDRRVVTVELTPKGKKFLNHQRRLVREMMAEHIDTMSAEEQARFHNALTECTALLRKIL